MSRVRFLTAEPIDPAGVRAPILASWQRSRQLQVDADEIELPYLRDPDIDTPLTRTALPVLRNLREALDGQPVSIILTDPAGLVLSRMTADNDLQRHLDRVLLAPGFSYAEEFVGTNGIGTALEVGAPTHVFGHEHYAEHLEDLACAGVPIHHPVSGRTVGVVDLTCWRKDAGSLLLTLAKTTAEQIRQALLAETSVHELELLHEYVRTCRRMTGIVFALNNDVVMLNDYARAVLDPADQAALLSRAPEAFAPGHCTSMDVPLPSGMMARMHCRLVPGTDGTAGLVVHAKLRHPPTEVTEIRPSAPMGQLPGLVGSAPTWLRACREVEQVYRSGDWLALEGEPGVGKLAILRAVQLRRQPVGRLEVLDGGQAGPDARWNGSVRETLYGGIDSVVIQHVDRMSGPRLRGLSAALQEARTAERDQPLWVAVTLGAGSPAAELEPLLRLFPSTVEVPALRLHLDDLPQLVSLFLARLGHSGHLACSPEAMQMLMRSSWPGNAAQLHDMLRQVVHHRRAGTIQPADLPAEARSVSRRRLSNLEVMERDAIVRALGDANGNKVQAARTLGMSRASIYRKIREFGIVVSDV